MKMDQISQLQDVINRLAAEVEWLRRERDEAVKENDVANGKLADLTKTIEQLRNEREQDQMIINKLLNKDSTSSEPVKHQSR
jgi:septal ring factor EnvC (AmiA/AmiB activator)